jgi:hypothetical protein
MEQVQVNKIWQVAVEVEQITRYYRNWWIRWLVEMDQQFIRPGSAGTS